MVKTILVIGGTRYFGKLLVQRLLRQGHQVTIATRGYAPDPFGDRIARVRVDRRNEHAMRAAFGASHFDVVYDQMCFSPLDAAISSRVFAGRVGRYVMTSTIDVYRHLAPQSDPFSESDLQVLAQPIDTDYPWHDPARAFESYVAGKIQAEAYLYRAGSMPVVSARLAHVLGGPDDFTGRLAHYVDLARQGAALPYTRAQARVSFLAAQQAVGFLAWSGAQAFTGPVNAADAGALSALELHQRVGQAIDTPVHARQMDPGAAPGTLSPFDFATSLTIDTGRATSLGYRFGHTDDWLDAAIRQHDLAFV